MKVEQLRKDIAKKENEIGLLKRESAAAKNESFILKQYTPNMYK